MQTYFSKISSLVLKFTDLYYKKIIVKILDSEEYITEPKRFFYTIILKSNGTIQSSNILIRNFHTHNHYHPSIYILLRSVLADIIVAEYIISLGQDDQKINDTIHSINLDHIERLILMLDKFYLKHNILTPEKVEEAKQDLIVNKKQFIDKNCLLKGKPLKTSPSKLIDWIFSQCSKDYDKRLLIRAFDYYETFSKYEHLGEFSFHLLHKGLDNSKLNNAFIEVYQSLEIIFSALLNYCNIWDFDKTEVIEQLKNIILELQKNNPSTMPSV